MIQVSKCSLHEKVGEIAIAFSIDLGMEYYSTWSLFAMIIPWL
jgi:hypothetical protein